MEYDEALNMYNTNIFSDQPDNNSREIQMHSFEEANTPLLLREGSKENYGTQGSPVVKGFDMSSIRNAMGLDKYDSEQLLEEARPGIVFVAQRRDVIDIQTSKNNIKNR